MINNEELERLKRLANSSPIIMHKDIKDLVIVDKDKADMIFIAQMVLTLCQLALNQNEGDKNEGKNS